MNTLTVTGMSCNHCREAVLKAVSALPGAENVTVDLASGKLSWSGEASPEAVSEAVSALGFDAA